MKQVLIIGFGKTGQAFYRHEKGEAVLAIYDDKPIVFDEPFEPYQPDVYYDYALISPGISPDHPVWRSCLQMAIPVYGEIEYAYHRLQGKIIGITGTNGKTTTTTLVYEMVQQWHERTFLAGNIGFPLLDYVHQSQADDIYVTELSSFQLETTHAFEPIAAAITNLTPDHLQWHGSMENYTAAKFRIFQNMPDVRQVVINRDDPMLIQALRDHGFEPDRFFGFSHETDLNSGCYVANGQIVYNDGDSEVIMSRNAIRLTGIHNLENCLCAISLAKKIGVPTHFIREVLTTFAGIEHRYEVITEKGGRRFINDSKATNPDSTIPALKSVEKPTVWIAGGMNKGSDFSNMFDMVNEQVKHLILFGENKLMMLEQAHEAGFHAITLVEDLGQAFELAIRMSESGYDILLSPASASWDMYPNFEARGDHFKRLVGEWNV